MSTAQDPNLAAEVRFVTEGHHAWLSHDADGWHCSIHSDTEVGKTYRVTVLADKGPGAPVFIRCQSSGGRIADHGDRSKTNGVAPCKHAAGVLHRLERAGLVRHVSSYIDRERGRASGGACWVATDQATADGVQALDLITAIVAEHAADEARAAVLREAAAGRGGDPFAGFPQ